MDDEHLFQNIDRDTLTAALLGSVFMVREWWLHPYVPEKGRVFIDVGANFGTWTKWLAPRFESVHAIDPNPAVIEGLRQGLPNNVTVHECAAWSSECTREFNRYACPDHLSGFFKDEFLVGTGPVLGTVLVPCQRIDTMRIHGEVDFIKVDCEGGEVEALTGALGALEKWHPRLMIEIHAKENWDTLGLILSGLGYQTLIIRHPSFTAGTELWHEHFWVDCQKRSE